jgi:diketogulonate reductase-like aldo/keto reductase
MYLRVVKDALAIGYRYIDCAERYKNQKEIGEGLSEVFEEGKIKREDLFITSKVFLI